MGIRQEERELVGSWFNRGDLVPGKPLPAGSVKTALCNAAGSYKNRFAAARAAGKSWIGAWWAASVFFRKAGSKGYNEAARATSAYKRIEFILHALSKELEFTETPKQSELRRSASNGLSGLAKDNKIIEEFQSALGKEPFQIEEFFSVHGKDFRNFILPLGKKEKTQVEFNAFINWFDSLSPRVRSGILGSGHVCVGFVAEIFASNDKGTREKAMQWIREGGPELLKDISNGMNPGVSKAWVGGEEGKKLSVQERLTTLGNQNPPIEERKSWNLLVMESALTCEEKKLLLLSEGSSLMA
jgi:hypothetical protein